MMLISGQRQVRSEGSRKSSRIRSNFYQEVIKGVMKRNGNNLYEFGEFCLDPNERVLRKAGEPVALPPKVFETLRILVERHGRIISKTEMMDGVWADAFVEESNLTQNIYTLRRILGADETGAHFIETVPRRGYRFVAPVFVRADSQTTAGFDPHHLEDRDAAYQVERDAEVDAGATGPPPAKKIENRGRRSLFRLPMLAMAPAAAAVIVFIFFFASNESGSFAPIEKVNFQKLTYTGDLTFPVISPDGSSFASVRRNQIVVQQIGSAEETPLTIQGHTVFGILQFSRDGNAIYFRNRVEFNLPASVFRVSRFGGEATEVAENVWSGVGFSADGRRMAFVRSSPKNAESLLMIKDLETGAEKQVASVGAPSSFLDNGHPAWSPDGKKIAVVVFRNTPRAPASELLVVDSETGQVEDVKQPQLWQFEQVVWSGDGSSMIVAARENGKFFQLWRLEYPSGALQRLTNDLNIYRGISLSADGTKLLARQFMLYSHLWIAEENRLEDMRQRTFGNLNRDGLGGLAWISTGDIVYVARIMGDYDLWLYRPADDSRRQLTKNSGEFNRFPTTAADGSRIFFDSNRTGSHHIWQADISDPSTQTQITFSEKGSEVFPQVAPDGNWIYYIHRIDKTSSIWRKSLTDTRTEALTEPGKLSPNSFLSISPDGKFLAFHNATEKLVEDSEQIYQIGVIPTHTRAEPKFVSIAASRLIVRWSPDGSGLDYIVNRPDAGEIWRQSVTREEPPSRVLTVPKAFLHNFAWSQDGKKLALSRGQQMNDALLLTNFRP
jgi:Tol biopolymer transport system component/DNA-binding winged helix-turn-helix (wHTH) protein